MRRQSPCVPLNCRSEADLCEGEFLKAKCFCSFCSSPRIRFLFFSFLYSVTVISCQRNPGPRTITIMVFDSRSLDAPLGDWFFKKIKCVLCYANAIVWSGEFRWEAEPFIPAEKANCHENRSSSPRRHLGRGPHSRTDPLSPGARGTFFFSKPQTWSNKPDPHVIEIDLSHRLF